MTVGQREYQRTVYDRHYPRHAKAVRDQLAHPLFRSFYDRLAARILDTLEAAGGGPTDPRRVRVFDAGCGEGLLGSALERVAADRGLRLEYTGADLSAAGVALARESVRGEVVVGEATEVAAGLPAAGCDLVVAKNLLHHLEDPAAFLGEVRRILAPGGRFVAAESRLGSPQIWVTGLLAPRRERYLFAGQSRNRRALAAAGLAVLSCRPFSWLPYELAFAVRFGGLRRLLSTGDPSAVRRVSAADERLTAWLPSLAAYVVWVAAVAREEPAPTGVRGTKRS